jgi:hypothetical protein
MTPWTIPNWPEPFDPAFEVPKLESLAVAVSESYPDIQCSPALEVPGCAFVNFHRGSMLIGRACVTEHESGLPFFSAYFGSDSDEFHGFNKQAIIELVKVYETEFPIE